MRTVYIHTTPDGKKYVGATHMKPEYRFNNGRGYRYQFFYQAVLKFGWENISHQLYEVDTEEELKYLERYLISYYDTTNPEKGYNIVKGDVTQDHGCDHPEYGKGISCYSQCKESYRKYQASEKGKEALYKYNHTNKRKEVQKKYQFSEKGKETSKRFRESEKGKESIKRYYTSEKGKETYKLVRQRWLETEKGKESIKLAHKRYDSSERGKEARKLAHQRYLEKKKKQMKNE